MLATNDDVQDNPDTYRAEAEEGAVATEEAARLRYPRIRPSLEEAIAIQRAVSVLRVTNNATSTIEPVRRKDFFWKAQPIIVLRTHPAYPLRDLEAIDRSGPSGQH